MLRTGSAKLVCRLEPEATTCTAHRLFKREGSCIAKRSWHEHSLHTNEKHLRVVKVATELNPADTLTKALGSKMEELCDEIGQTELHAKTGDKKPMETKKPKTVKFAVDTNDDMIQNKLTGSRIEMIQNKLNDSRVAKIKNETKDAKLRWMHTID